MKKRLYFVIVLIFLFVSFNWLSTAQAQNEKVKKLFIVGGGFNEIVDEFSDAAIANAVDKNVNILILLVTGRSLSKSEVWQENQEIAEEYKEEIKASCTKVAPQGLNCLVSSITLTTRADAESQEVTKAFRSDLSAIVILGDEQKFTMQILTGTPVEEELIKAYEQGVLIASAGSVSNILSRNMLAGYAQGFSHGNDLEFGAVELWGSLDKRGLSIGIGSAILEQDFFRNNRVGRLVNVMTLPDVPHLGIGVEAYSGFYVVDHQQIRDVFGLYTIAILDADTYQAANTANYLGQRNMIALRNVLVHLLAPGDFYYDLDLKQHSLEPPAPRIERKYENFVLPPGAGALMISGDLRRSLSNNPIFARFVNLCGGQKANILVITTGYPTDRSAQNASKQYEVAIKASVRPLVVSVDSAPIAEIPADITGIIFIGKDQSLIQLEHLPDIKSAWLAGIPILADNAAAAVMGSFYSAHPATPDDPDSAEAATLESFKLGKTDIKPGLGILDISIEPQIIKDNRWGRLFSLAYNHPELLAIGVDESTALFIEQNATTVIGENAVIVLDLHEAKLDIGDNQAYVIANGLLDVFSSGDLVLPTIADMDAEPIHAATPALPAPTFTETPIPPPPPTLSPTPTVLPPTETAVTIQKLDPTNTPRPTATPLVIPPPTDPNLTTAMIVVGLFAVLVVIVGVWINRRRILQNNMS